LPRRRSESGRLREAPTGRDLWVPDQLAGTGLRRGECKDRKRDLWSARCQRVEVGTSVSIAPPAETGLRPGACEIRQHQDPGPWTARQTVILRPLRLRPSGGGDGTTEPSGSGSAERVNRQDFGRVGEPAGKPERAQAREGLRRIGARASAQVRPRTAPSGLPRLPGLVSAVKADVPGTS
jgi:hypothetical protein